jgi:C-terminal processing protease CtpA/Prc
MKITHFNGDENEIEHFYKQSFKSLLDHNSSHLILDFRGHIGGADSYGENLAKYFAKEPFRKLSKAYWKITPEFKEAFDRKFVPKSIRWFKPIYLVNEYSSIFYGAEPNELVTLNYEMKNPLSEEKRFPGNVYLITDHNTFSAGSIFAEMFKYYKMGRDNRTANR